MPPPPLVTQRTRTKSHGIISISFYNFLFQYIRTNMKRLNAYNYIEGGVTVNICTRSYQLLTLIIIRREEDDGKYQWLPCICPG